MTNKTKILFVNDEMEMGGVARVLNTLMANLDTDKFDISCLVLHKTGMLLSEIPSHVNVIEGTPFFNTIDRPLIDILNRMDIKALFSKLRLLFYMKTGLIKKRILIERKKIINETYDVELAAKEGFCTVFTAYGDSKKKINWVLTDYKQNNYSKNHMSLVIEALQKIDMNIADSEDVLQSFKEVFGITRGITIHNLMDIEKVKQGIQIGYEDAIVQPGLNVIAVARFHPQKSLERLLYAYKNAVDKGIEHNLYLIGGGETEPLLRQIVKDNNLNRVFFLGYKQNPYAYIAKCDLFVLSSLYEGFATIINESLIAGTPVLTTRVGGVSDQIVEDYQGWIVENTLEALKAGYLTALSKPDKLNDMKQTLKSYEYPNDKILKQFEEVFK
ncbi:glycosyltransferase [Anaerorhabdus sp.]|uniref:glycosyltransferase n=1 Tax=Anaerorhabdus sp. TaxID=1872524 RepID=UPI002FC6067F